MNNGENDLDKLLRTLRPVLAEDKYVYCHEASSQDAAGPGTLHAVFGEGRNERKKN